MATRPTLEPGDRIAGKYRVENKLGEGGMGVVVAAIDVRLERRVAIKLLRHDALGDPEARARFEREARAVARLKSEHVVRVLDVGELDDGAPYIVMEHLDGRDLAAELSERGPMSVPVAVRWLLEACEALAEAHAAGIVHRDVKPWNLFLARQPDGSSLVKVLDFGVAKSSARGELVLTQGALGTPLYMAPEQIREAQHVDERCDVWALGVVLFELLTKETPFDAPTANAVCARIIEDAPEPPSRLCPKLSRGLDQVVLRCLEKDPTRRYRNVAELAHALAQHGDEDASRSAERIARVLGPGSAPTLEQRPRSPVPAATSVAGGLSAPAERQTGPAPFALGLLLAAAVAAGVWWTMRQRSAPPAAEPASGAAAPASAAALPPLSPEARADPTIPRAPSASVPTAVAGASATVRAQPNPRASAQPVRARPPGERPFAPMDIK